MKCKCLELQTNGEELMRGSRVYEGTHKPFDASSSIHATLSLPAGTTLFDASGYLDKWLLGITRVLKVNSHSLSYFGCLLSQPRPHIHLCIRSPKSRITGKTISTLSSDMKDSLCRSWEGMTGTPATGSAAKIETIFDIAGLLGYMAGTHNADRPLQEMYLISSQTNS
jgi:hypothetical protein